VVLGEAVDVGEQLGELLREVVTPFAATAQRVGGELVGAGCAAEAEVDPTGMQPLEDTEGLCDRQRRMVPPLPTRIVLVAAATDAIITIGALLATLAMLWCSASQYRW
jgi:hypothetical protein